MKSKFIMALMLVALLVTVCACSQEGNESTSGVTEAEESKEKITLKFAAASSSNNVMVTEVFTPFMERVTELTEGQVEFEFYPAEQLGKAGDLYELTGAGVADIGVYFPPYYPSAMPITSALTQIPGLYTTAHAGGMTYHELSKQSPILETDFLHANVRPLISVAGRPSELWSKGKEIKTPADVKGMKVRVSGELINQAISDLGASPINIGLPELYEGLERGVFNSVNINAVTMSDYDLADLVDYGTSGVEFGGTVVGVLINEKVFQGLPKDVQEILVQAGDEFTEVSGKRYDAANDKVNQEFKDNGMKITELTEDEKKQWEKFYSEAEKDFLKAQNNPELEEVLDTFRENVKKYN